MVLRHEDHTVVVLDALLDGREAPARGSARSNDSTPRESPIVLLSIAT